MSHVLVITGEDLECMEDFKFDIECDGEGCDLWQECNHSVHLLRFDDRYDYDANDPLTEHGLPHAQVEGMWCIPYPGCAYKQTLGEGDSHWDIAREHGAGRWVVEHDWIEWGSGELLFVVPADNGEWREGK